MQVSPSPIQLTLDEIKAAHLMASLTDEEREGIQSTVQDKLTVLQLPPSFSWVSVPPAPGPSLFRRLHLAMVPNGAARIQVVFNAQNEIVEVNVL